MNVVRIYGERMEAGPPESVSEGHFHREIGGRLDAAKSAHSHSLSPCFRESHKSRGGADHFVYFAIHVHVGAAAQATPF